MLDLTSSVHKTFALLDYFTIDKPEWGVTELANQVGANKSTVFRFLAQMQSIGILEKSDQSEKYKLGLKLFELGNRVELRSAFIEKTHPALQSVATDITETVHVGVLKNNQVFYVDKVESPLGLKISSHIGTFNAAYATALGKVLLAFVHEDLQSSILDNIYRDTVRRFTANTIVDRNDMEKELITIKQKGYAIDKEEFEIGLICVAIPIFNMNHEVVASLSASGPAQRFKENEVENYVAILSKGADAIKNRIGTFKLI